MHDGEVIEIPAHPADRVVDTTGAGDLYAAGFLYGYTAGRPLEVVRRLGSMAATAVLGHTGPRPGPVARPAGRRRRGCDRRRSLGAGRARRPRPSRSAPGSSGTTCWWCSARGGRRRPTASATTTAEVPIARAARASPTSGVAGHAGVLRSVEADGGRRILALLGRVHAYEGHDLSVVVHARARGGARRAAAPSSSPTRRAGSAPGMHVGQPVLISDHINLTGRSPLTGPAAPDELGLPRFVDLTEAYSRRLRDLAREVDPTLEEGVYAGVPGPAVRDARRDPHAPDPRRRPGRA